MKLKGIARSLGGFSAQTPRAGTGVLCWCSVPLDFLLTHLAEACLVLQLVILAAFVANPWHQSQL